MRVAALHSSGPSMHLSALQQYHPFRSATVVFTFVTTITMDVQVMFLTQFYLYQWCAGIWRLDPCGLRLHL